MNNSTTPTRRRTLLIAMLAALALLGAACSDTTDEATPDDAEVTEAAADPSDAEAAGTSFELELTGDTEVPGPGSDGSGTATLTIADGEACLTGELTDVAAVSAGHIHQAPEGEAGDVVVDLGVTTTEDGAIDSCGEIDEATADAIAASPSDFYVNLHNAEYPDGAVRAQLS